VAAPRLLFRGKEHVVLLKRAADMAFGEATVARICRERRRGSFPERGLQKSMRSPLESFGLVLICMCVKGKGVLESGRQNNSQKSVPGWE